MPRLIYLAYLVAYCISLLDSSLSGPAGPTVAQIIFKALHYFTNQSLSLSHPGLSIDLISVQRETVRLRCYMISIMYAGASFSNLHHVGFLYWPAVRWTPEEPVV